MRYFRPVVFLLYLRRGLLISGLSVALSWLIVMPPAQASLQQTWEQLWASFNRRPPPAPYRRGGSRGPGEPCPIAPIALPNVAMVWSEQPTFVWDGEVEKITVRLANSGDELWNASVTGLNHITYTGEALLPDVRYQWLVFTPDSGDEPQRIISFQVMPPQQRNLIAQQLPSMQQDEAIAIERAYYFAQQELWSDFWREVFAVNQPSDKLSGLIDQTINVVCEEN